jgi:hypothetical protein
MFRSLKGHLQVLKCVKKLPCWTQVMPIVRLGQHNHVVFITVETKLNCNKYQGVYLTLRTPCGVKKRLQYILRLLVLQRWRRSCRRGTANKKLEPSIYNSETRETLLSLITLGFTKPIFSYGLSRGKTSFYSRLITVTIKPQSVSYFSTFQLTCKLILSRGHSNLRGVEQAKSMSLLNVNHSLATITTPLNTNFYVHNLIPSMMKF